MLAGGLFGGGGGVRGAGASAQGRGQTERRGQNGLRGDLGPGGGVGIGHVGCTVRAEGAGRARSRGAGVQAAQVLAGVLAVLSVTREAFGTVGVGGRPPWPHRGSGAHQLFGEAAVSFRFMSFLQPRPPPVLVTAPGGDSGGLG